MTWWEDQSYAPIALSKITCPVCKADLGQRSEGDRKWVHCNECRCDFYFAPHKDIPTRSRLDSACDHRCGCGRCGN
jgi:hypothetical protein